MTQTKYFKQPSVMNAQAHFSQVPNAEIPRSRFDRSHAHKTTFDAGQLIPVLVDEVLPGDTFDVQATQFSRLATPLHPLMDNIYQDIHFFFIPTRLVMSQWEFFNGERTNPTDDPSTVTIPQTTIVLGDIQPHSVASYMGLPYRPGVGGVSVSALFFRAYDLVYNDWYRDQTLQDSIVFSTGAGPDNYSAYTQNGSCHPRGKRKDYFTSALPWPQKGDPVIIPLGDTAPVTFADDVTVRPIRDLYNDSTNALIGTLRYSNFTTVNSPPPNVADPGVTVADDGSPSLNVPAYLQADITPADFAAGTPTADLSAASAVSVNDLRTAVQIQKFLERDARGGTRYVEILWTRFGVRSDDARLQRPEFLGGGTVSVNINPIAQTSVAASTPQGNLAAIGTSVLRGGFKKAFTEHGILLGIASVRADLTYQQGVNRMWFRETLYDFYDPMFAHLGEQAIENREIFVQGTSADTDVFGYQERFAEYRYKPSILTGLMSSEQASSLDVWHLGQDFEALPVLNGAFIEENPPIDRVIAVPAEPHFIADFWFDVKCDRPMPIYSVPGLDTL